MKAIIDNIKIELDDYFEISQFWNIIMTALDYDKEAKKNGQTKLTDGERQLAKKLADATARRW